MELPKACLFDLDGVLLDSEKLHGEAWSNTASKYGITLKTSQLMLLKGRRRKECAELIIGWIKRPITVQNLLAIHEPISKGLMLNVEAIPGAEEIIYWCYNNGIKLALVSSSTSSSITIKSRHHQWLKLIKTRVQGDDKELREAKPAPDPYILAANKLGLEPKDCWAIEDSESGSISALEAGCQVWILNRNFKKNKTYERMSSLANPYDIDQLSEVLMKLKDGLEF